ncbi:MAG: hypothetical protein AAB879_00465, partial [Patescibacteria group bacterium]
MTKHRRTTLSTPAGRAWNRSQISSTSNNCQCCFTGKERDRFGVPRRFPGNGSRVNARTTFPPIAT